MGEFASKGVGTAGLTTGIIGTAGFGLNLLSNLMGGGAGAPGGNAVSHDDLDKAMTIAAKDGEIALLKANDYVNEKLLAVYNTIDSKVNSVIDTVYKNREEQSAINTQQAVYNATNNTLIGCMQNQINTLMGMTKTVIPNDSVCPGWGTATVSVSTGTTTA